MPHLHNDLLLRYLHDETGPGEVEHVVNHLAKCQHCSDTLATISAEDDRLMEALALDAGELDWIESIDLTNAVMQQVRPDRTPAQIVLLVALLTIPTGWVIQQVVSGLAGALSLKGPVGLSLDLVRFGIDGLLTFLTYVSHGGLLPQLTPILLLVGVYLIWRRPVNERGILR